MSKIKLISVGELAGLYASPELLPPGAERSSERRETFIVPDYQRGYRWSSEIQVSALLEDILDFMQKPGRTTSEIYCLQPLVVTRSLVEPDCWEVIDGQQRLTTLYLIFLAFGMDKFNLKYETRPNTGQFLKELTGNNGEIPEDNPDFHYIREAWKFITQWRSERVLRIPNFKTKFPSVLAENVNVIWYDVESEKRADNIDIFNRLNVGKIPLTESELVKALLLCKCKELYKGEELALRQAEISSEFYSMEAELRKPHKWGFLSSKNRTSHMDILLELIIAGQNPQKLTPYLWFEKTISDTSGLQGSSSQRPEGGQCPESDTRRPEESAALDLWKEIKSVFGTVDAWFCENGKKPTIYHYAGYLLASGIKSIEEIYSMAKGAGKKQFKKKLRKAIVDDISKRLRATGALDANGKISLENLEYGKDSELVLRLLLLLNVLSCEKIAHGQYNRFPFERYAAGKWSIEHIYPQNPESPLRDRADIRKWITMACEGLKNIVYVQDPEKKNNDEEVDFGKLKTELESMAGLPDKQIDLDTFNTLRKNILNVFISEPLHGFANLALLGRDENAALNNAPFPIKRDRILKKEQEGGFIPPCTRNIFLKFYSDSNSQPYFWSNSDQDAYLEAMELLLDWFFKENDNDEESDDE